LLDISLGGTPQEGAVTMQEIKHDPRELPYPLPTASVHTCVVTHVLEYLAPSQFFAFWNEVHRIVRPLGVVYVSGPYGGDESHGWLSDPQHQTRVIEQSFAWLDPRLPFYELHPSLGRALPRPWYGVSLARVPAPNSTVSYNVMLQAQPMNGHGGAK
jgi:hypothetical protein